MCCSAVSLLLLGVLDAETPHGKPHMSYLLHSRETNEPWACRSCFNKFERHCCITFIQTSCISLEARTWNSQDSLSSAPSEDVVTTEVVLSPAFSTGDSAGYTVASKWFPKDGNFVLPPSE